VFGTINAIGDMISKTEAQDAIAQEFARYRASLTPEPVRPTPPTIDWGNLPDEPYLGGGAYDPVSVVHELRAEVTRLTAELARMDQIANDRGTEVIRLEQRLEKLKHLLCSECTRVTENLR